MLEERHGYEAARAAYEYADEHLYAADVRDARDAALARVVQLVRDGAGTVLDIATGRGRLLELLLRGTDRPLVASDVSATVLEGVRARLGDERIRYVTADVRRLPFEDGSLPAIVSHLGLANVPAGALRELRRVGRELAVTHLFYPEADDENRAAARAAGLETMLVRTSALAALAEAGWEALVEAEWEVRARPTPESALVRGTRIDALPVADTTTTWCVLRAR